MKNIFKLSSLFFILAWFIMCLLCLDYIQSSTFKIIIFSIGSLFGSSGVIGTFILLSKSNNAFWYKLDELNSIINDHEEAKKEYENTKGLLNKELINNMESYEEFLIIKNLINDKLSNQLLNKYTNNKKNKICYDYSELNKKLLDIYLNIGD